MVTNAHPHVPHAADPTDNVKDLLAAAMDSMAALRSADKEETDVRIGHIREMAELRAEHVERLRASDLGSWDKTRDVDVKAAASSAAQLATAVSALQAVTDRNNEALRNQVANTATTMAKQTSEAAVATQLASDNLFRRMDERMAIVERNIATGIGRQSVVDPQMSDFVKDMKAVLLTQSTEGGKGQGISMAWGILIAVVVAGLSLVSVGVSVYAAMKP